MRVPGSCWAYCNTTLENAFVLPFSSLLFWGAGGGMVGGRSVLFCCCCCFLSSLFQRYSCTFSFTLYFSSLCTAYSILYNSYSIERSRPNVFSFSLPPFLCFYVDRWCSQTVSFLLRTFSFELLWFSRLIYSSTTIAQETEKQKFFYLNRVSMKITAARGIDHNFRCRTTG